MKIKKILISIICLLFIQLVNASVVNASEVYFSYPTTVTAGEEFTVKLFIKNANNLKYVQATNYRIDSDKLELVDFDTLAPFVGTGVGNSPFVSIDGAMGFEMNSATPKSGTVEVLYLKFKVKETVRVNDLINIKMDKVFISVNEDGTNPENISNDEGYCLTIRVIENQTTETPKCKVVDGKYYDNNGNIVSKTAYESACGVETTETPKCKVVDGKYYDNNGNIVSKTAYESACGVETTETPKCKVVDGKYYDNNGNIVSKTAYESACGVENPETGINTTIVVVIAGTLLAIGCYAFFRKNKMYY